MYVPDLARAERAMEAVKQRTRGLDEKSRTVGEALFVVQDEMLLLAKKYETAAKAYRDGGGLDISEIRTVEQLGAREALVVSVGKANDDLLSFCRNIDTRVTTALAGIEMAPYERDEVGRNYKKGASLELVMQIRQLDEEITRDSAAALRLLRQQWGKWKLHGGTVRFDRASIVSDFNSLLGRIAAAQAKQVELQRQIVEQKVW
jgi:hypothetical protein